MPLPISFFLDTNMFILISGLDSNDLSILSKAITENKITLSISHVQIDEQSNLEFSDYKSKIEEALRRFGEKGISITVEPTIEMVADVSRWDYTRWGNERLNGVDEALRKEMEKCTRRKGERTSNVAKDALIALSSLNHDFFYHGRYMPLQKLENCY